MRIEKLTLQNFRLFERREFSFHPQFNLIIGENGSGKSSLLRALAIALSSVLPELGVAKENIIKIKSDDARLHIIGNESISFVSEDLVNVVLVLQEEKRSVLRKVSTNQITVNQPRFFDYNLMVKDSFIAPLCAFYTCSRFWTPQKNKTDLMIKAMQEKYHRKDGYLNWNDNLETDESFILWVQKQDIITYQEREVSLGWKILNKAMKICFENFDSFLFNAKLGELIIKLNKNGNIENLLFKNLSDGQRCMIGLIGDMVRRAVLLNPQLGDKILEETSGVVLIDELDLHLHPKWQRRIIDDLKTTFPKVQFICTTHSPFLIQSLRSGDELIMLDDSSDFEGVNKSIEDIVESVQGVFMPQRSKRFQDMMAVAEQYYTELHSANASDEVEKLRQKLDEMTIPYSDDPAFVAFLKMERETFLAQNGSKK